MLDIVGKQIEKGDLLLEVYDSGKAIFPHVASGKFTPRYIKTICTTNSDLLCVEARRRVMPKSIIVITEEQFLGFVEKEEAEYNRLEIRINHEEEDAEYILNEIEKLKLRSNRLIEISRKLKAEQ